MTKQGLVKEDIDNLKEYQMLVQYAQKRAEMRVEETQKQLQAAINENVRLIEETTQRAISSDNNSNLIIPLNSQETTPNAGDMLAVDNGNIVYIWNDEECKWVKVEG